jgi:hypothetical protein
MVLIARYDALLDAEDQGRHVDSALANIDRQMRRLESVIGRTVARKLVREWLKKNP